MRTMMWAGAMLIASGLSVPLSAAAAPAQSASQTSADARLKALYNGYAAWDAKESGVLQNADGESKPASYLPRIDPASQQRRAAHLQALLTQLNAIPAAQLSA